MEKSTHSIRLLRVPGMMLVAQLSLGSCPRPTPKHRAARSQNKEQQGPLKVSPGARGTAELEELRAGYLCSVWSSGTRCAFGSPRSLERWRVKPRLSEFSFPFEILPSVSCASPRPSPLLIMIASHTNSQTCKSL